MREIVIDLCCLAIQSRDEERGRKGEKVKVRKESKSEGETTQNVERLKGSNIQQSQHNNQINEQAHLLWHIADMGIFIYTKNPPSLY